MTNRLIPCRLTGLHIRASVSGTGSNGGSLDGSLSGSSLSITLTPSNPLTCPFNVTATRNGNTITGTYAAFNCTIAVSGSVSLTKE